jgi:hypothetical protein
MSVTDDPLHRRKLPPAQDPHARLLGRHPARTREQVHPARRRGQTRRLRRKPSVIVNRAHGLTNTVNLLLGFPEGTSSVKRRREETFSSPSISPLADSFRERFLMS